MRASRRLHLTHELLQARPGVSEDERRPLVEEEVVADAGEARALCPASARRRSAPDRQSRTGIPKIGLLGSRFAAGLTTSLAPITTATSTEENCSLISSIGHRRARADRQRRRLNRSSPWPRALAAPPRPHLQRRFTCAATSCRCPSPRQTDPWAPAHRSELTPPDRAPTRRTRRLPAALVAWLPGPSMPALCTCRSPCRPSSGWGFARITGFGEWVR
jgi:hypothetical protein